MNKRQRDLLSLAYGGTVVDPAAFGESLKAAVLLFDKLPKTEDGVVIVPGQTYVIETGRGHLFESLLHLDKHGVVATSDFGDRPIEFWDEYNDPKASIVPARVWSTMERAEIAHHLANGPHDHDHLEDK
jgi:hypothetical protein